MVIESQPHVRFVLIGSGPDESKTRDEVRSLSLSNNFIFTGFVPHEEINKYLSVGDVMVAPYTSELGAEQGRAEMGRSFKVLEYMAAAKPVVVTAVADLGGTIEHGVAGLVIENDEPIWINKKDTLEVIKLALLSEQEEIKDSYIDYNRQFEKSFLDPMKGLLETIGWDYERKSTLMDFFT